MASIGKVSAVFSANTSGLTAGVNTAVSAFGKLGGNARQLGASFSTLQAIGARGPGDVGPAAEAAGAKFQQFTRLAEGLRSRLEAGTISAEDFARRMGQIDTAAAEAASAMSRGTAVTERFLTADEKLSRAQNELNRLFNAGAIDAGTLQRALAQAQAEFAATDAASVQLAAAMQRGASITDQFLTAEDRLSRQQADLNSLFQAGAIDAGTLERALAQAETEFRATDAASVAAAAAMQRGASITEQFLTAEDRLAKQQADLNSLFQAGAIDAGTLERALAQAQAEFAATDAASVAAAAAMQQGASVTERFLTAEERLSRRQAELNNLFSAGAIDAQTLERALADAQREFDATDAAAQEAAETMRRGAAVTDRFRTAEDKLAREQADLNRLFDAGAIDAGTLQRALDQAEREFRQADNAADGLAAGMRRTADNTDGLRGRLNALVAIQVANLFANIGRAALDAGRAMLRMGSDQAALIDQNAKLAAGFGFTYGEMAGLSLAAELSGVSMEQMTMAMGKANQLIDRAARGAKPAAEALGRLGLSADQLSGMSASDQFDAIATAIAALPTEAERAAAAMAIFGEQGGRLVPLFSQGAGGIAQARAEAEAFGLALTDEQASAVEGMNDAFTRARAAISGVIGQVTAYLAPAIDAVTTTFSDFIGSVGGANIGQSIADALLDGAIFAAEIFDSIIVGFGGAMELGGAVAQAFAVAWDLASRVAQALYGAFRLLNAAGAFIGGVFSDVVAGLFRVGARLAGLIPGFGDAASQLSASADSWAATGQTFKDSASQAASDAGQSFSAAMSANAAQPDQADGPLSGLLRQARETARQQAAARPTAPQAAATATQTIVAVAAPATEAIKATDSRSSEGVAEMFRLMRGQGGNVQDKQLKTQERMAQYLQAMASQEQPTDVAFAFGGA